MGLTVADLVTVITAIAGSYYASSKLIVASWRTFLRLPPPFQSARPRSDVLWTGLVMLVSAAAAIIYSYLDLAMPKWAAFGTLISTVLLAGLGLWALCDFRRPTRLATSITVGLALVWIALNLQPSFLPRPWLPEFVEATTSIAQITKNYDLKRRQSLLAEIAFEKSKMEYPTATDNFHERQRELASLDGMSQTTDDLEKMNSNLGTDYVSSMQLLFLFSYLTWLLPCSIIVGKYAGHRHLREMPMLKEPADLANLRLKCMTSEFLLVTDGTEWDSASRLVRLRDSVATQ